MKPLDSSDYSPVRKKVNLTVWLKTFLVLCIGATLGLLRRDPVFALRLDNLLYHNEIASKPSVDVNAAEKMDPGLGSQLPTTAAGMSIRKAASPGASGHLIVFLGDCAGCISFNFKTWSSEIPPSVDLIGLSSSSPEGLALFKQQSHISTPIIRDPNQELSKQINAYWSGRVYYYDHAWQLRWKMDGFANPYSPRTLPTLRALWEHSEK